MYFSIGQNKLLKMHIDSIVFIIFLVVNQLTSTIPYNNDNVLQVFLIAIVHVILFSKMSGLTPSYGIYISFQIHY